MTRSASIVSLVVFAGAAAAATSCGGGGNGPPSGAACTAFSACGGDPVGNWKLDPGCFSPKPSPAGSCGEMLDLAKVNFGATMIFRADRTVTLTYTASGPAKFDIPEACLTKNGVTTACADAGTDYTTRVFVAGGKVSSTSCQPAGAVCSCALDLMATPVSTTTMYTTSGTTLALDAGTSFDYCATPTELRLRGITDGGTDSSMLVLRRQ